MKKLHYLLSLFLFFLLTINVQSADITDSVIKVFATKNPMDYLKPWQSKGIGQAGGSGCIIEGNKIMTNAHVVQDSTFVQVKKNADPKKYTAKIESICYDCDLAILSVEDKSFFENAKPLDFGQLPNLQDTVTVLGYPTGGDELSITKGVVSRIEIINYAQSNRKLLGVQIDAPINPGNSGGPVTSEDKVVGIAMQNLTGSQNIGYIIPVPVIEHFLSDIKDGTYDGFPLLGIEFQESENKTAKEYYKINEKQGGVIITKVLPFSPSEGLLKEGDILLEIDGTPIAEDGTFVLRSNERLLLTHLINKKQQGENIKLKIIRNGETVELSAEGKNFSPLVPYPNYSPKPSYYIFGGLVFSVLTTDLIEAYGSKWWEQAPLDFLSFLIGKDRLNKENKKELVVLLSVLPDDINAGYHGQNNDIISRINGQSFSSFEEFVKLVDEGKKNSAYTIFDTENSYKIILSNKDIDLITQEITKRNNIPSQYSDDVKTWISENTSAKTE
ncbi:MAG: trypsin-like peptidase domain-containing protein [Candidatus Omnitrophica bacterium]|nr:trypsin-like peptidase domain-containing protein [Candidatus Omnitrophota bacterium]